MEAIISALFEALIMFIVEVLLQGSHHVNH
jgi:hypothetical protein